MGYSGGRLADIAIKSEQPLRDAADRTAERARRWLLLQVRDYTPVAKPPPGAAAEWLASRGRMPGTLRESWKEGEVAHEGDRISTEVYTDDPVAPHVEYPTSPHIIRPRDAQMLRWWNAAGATVFAYIVHHPGTHGVYMMARALADLDIEWQAIGAEEMARWSKEVEAMI